MEKNKDKSNITPQSIYLVGNPNSGKTSLFNAITGERHHVGNWPGVTVERLEGVTHTKDGDIHITDLPGTYSLSPATPEEALVLATLDEASRGTVLNVVDSTNMIRNLFLTTQLIELGINPVISLNCYDSFTEQGGKIDLSKFTELTGCDIYPTVGRTGVGVTALVEYLAKRDKNRTIVNKSGLSLPESWFKAAQEALKLENLRWETATATQRFNAINSLVRPKEENEKLEAIREKLCNELTKDAAKPVTKSTLACNLAEDRYHRIEKLIPLCATVPEKSIPEWQQKMDKVLVHKYLGVPVFALLMLFVFWTTFTIGQFPMDWLEAFVEWLAGKAEGWMTPGILRDLVVNAGIKSVGSVIVFIPNILILFFWIVLLEDSGYMSRAAFIVDRLMKSIGLQGRAFIPMVMGVGCNVPAIMATRIIDSKFQRWLTMFLIPLVTCNARLPILVLLCGTFFPNNPSLWMFALFVIDLVVLMFLGHFISMFFQTVEDSPFMLEMPPYRIPTPKSVWNMLKEKAMHFIEKAGTVVLAGSIIIWALSAFPRNIPLSFDYEGQKALIEAPYNLQKANIEKNTQLSDKEKEEKLAEIESQMADATSEIEFKKNEEQTEKSYLGRMGGFFAPVMKPLGFTWKETVTLIPGFFAKESLVSTLAVLYQTKEEEDDDNEKKLENRKKLAEAMKKNGMTPLKAFVYMLFTLLYVPCIATVGVLWKETGSTKFTIFSLLCYFGIAYGVSFAVLKVGEIITSRGSAGAQESLVVIIALIAAWIMLARLINALKGKPGAVGCGGGCDGCSRCNLNKPK